MNKRRRNFKPFHNLQLVGTSGRARTERATVELCCCTHRKQPPPAPRQGDPCSPAASCLHTRATASPCLLPAGFARLDLSSPCPMDGGLKRGWQEEQATGVRGLSTFLDDTESSALSVAPNEAEMFWAQIYCGNSAGRWQRCRNWLSSCALVGAEVGFQQGNPTRPL